MHFLLRHPRSGLYCRFKCILTVPFQNSAQALGYYKVGHIFPTFAKSLASCFLLAHCSLQSELDLPLQNLLVAIMPGPFQNSIARGTVAHSWSDNEALVSKANKNRSITPDPPAFENQMEHTTFNRLLERGFSLQFWVPEPRCEANLL